MEANTQYNKARYDLALAIWDDGAVLTPESDHPLVIERNGPNGKERGFKLKLHEKNPEAPLSKFYLNLRTPDNPKPGPLSPETVDLGARCMRHIQYQGKLVSDTVAGIPRAGDPFAQVLARLSGLPFLELEKYEYGNIRCIASVKGRVPAAIRKALVVDDLITAAESKREAIQILRDNSIAVTDVIVLVDREQNGAMGLAEFGCELHSVFTITELLDFYVAADRMEPHLRDHIHSYLQSYLKAA